MLGLVLRHPGTYPFQLPCGGRYEGEEPDAHYPINFVVKDPRLVELSRRPRPEAVETSRTNKRSWPACLLIGVTYMGGSDQETANESGGADRARTGDPLLAKQVLSQLSYSPTSGHLRQRWWAWVESNYRPHPYQGCALTN